MHNIKAAFNYSKFFIELPDANDTPHSVHLKH